MFARCRIKYSATARLLLSVANKFRSKQESQIQLNAIICLVIACLTNLGCATSREDDAPAEYLRVSGWQNIDAQLQAPDFDRYRELVANDVAEHRIPVDPNRRVEEIAMVTPIEIPPLESCNGQQRGIALLVHGLSDTAFAMRDLAQVLASQCVRARTVLLPGHGTRAGDLLDIQLKDWEKTLEYLIDQAAHEHDRIVLAGFSLGAVLSMSAALKPDSTVDALIAVSPAYDLSSWRLARWAPWFYRLRPWIDRGIADDAMRYEAMPTRGVAETVRAIKRMRENLAIHGSVTIPWLLVQSSDDAVTVPAENIRIFEQFAANSISRVVEFTGQNTNTEANTSPDPRILHLPGFDGNLRVLGLTHTAVHQSPDNQHYGARGRYRNCGGTAPRIRDAVKKCEAADVVWYGLWGQTVESGRAQAMSTFNPNFRMLAEQIRLFTISALPLAGEP